MTADISRLDYIPSGRYVTYQLVGLMGRSRVIAVLGRRAAGSLLGVRAHAAHE